MSDVAEDAIAQAERHVREGEERIARQAAVVEGLERNGHAADKGRVLLATLPAVLDTWRVDVAHLGRTRDRNGS
jgi:hypothetical protein